MDCRSANAVGIALLVTLLAGGLEVQTGYAQSARVAGFVTDRADGRPLPGATVALYRYAEEFNNVPSYGTVADAAGVYIIGGIEPGRYLLEVTFVGYETHRDTVALGSGDVLTAEAALNGVSAELGEIVVEGARLHGMADTRAGHQRISADEIERIPTPGLSGDLAAYLTSLPGVFTTGDRGGQFFIRGGEPSQNLALVDGSIVYQPFHVLGTYSAFPSAIVREVDFYAGGFGAQYAGRLSSVIDVTTRSGNNRHFGGSASTSPFVSALLVEGPLWPGESSFLTSFRASNIDRAGELFYGRELPFYFSDFLAKADASPGNRNRFSVTYYSTTDRGSLVPEVGTDVDEEIWWTNSGGSLRWLMLPRSLPLTAQLTIARSKHVIEQGTVEDTIRTSRVRNTRIALDAAYAEGGFFGGRIATMAGWELVLGHARNDFGGLFQNADHRGGGIPRLGLYLAPNIRLLGGIRLSPGLRMQFYNVQHRPYLEPRIRATWDRGGHRISAAIGYHRQQVVGLTAMRDASSIYTAWTDIPRVRDRPPRRLSVVRIPPSTIRLVDPSNAALDRIGGELLHGRVGTAVHVIGGYRVAPMQEVAVSIEGFYKQATNLFVAELSPFPGVTTRLMPATGRTYGFEARAQIDGRGVRGFVTYGFSNTVYAADGRAVSWGYRRDRLRYRPPHDRRHHINALLQASLRQFQFSIRWQFGSGSPFTMPIAFDRFVLVDAIQSAEGFDARKRVVFEEPFGAVLPTYHRLDVSVERTFDLKAASITLLANVINMYDRRNIFYFDVFTLKRENQFPILPSLAIELAFE